ncbi:MAG: sugar phosphate isomerase/epimerase [Armatimonadetes bacterium]|nr:sugar phosphate isomerase/epimerase [Armatimonadota bacterium]
MKIEQVAAQLYTIRDFIQTPEDIASSLKKIREIGYSAIQISGMGPIDEGELSRILQGEGLTCCATHEPGARIISEPEAIVERLNKLDCKYTAYPYPAGVDFSTLDAVKSFAADLNSAGKVLYDSGKTLAYHNHQIEFRRFAGQTILDIIYAETDPRYLQGEIDAYWVQYGGGNPLDWCKKLKGRLPLLHMKDYMITNDNQPTFAEIGNGNLDWKSIVAEAESGGCEWFIVEQDTCAGDPFDSLRISFEYVEENLV